MEPRPAIRLAIHGRVQGVGYRWWATREATRLGLAGWVRNRTDGSVELVAIGPAGTLDALANACAQGPAAATVTRIDRTEAPDDGATAFEQRPTA